MGCEARWSDFGRTSWTDSVWPRWVVFRLDSRNGRIAPITVVQASIAAFPERTSRRGLHLAAMGGLLPGRFRIERADIGRSAHGKGWP
jgi:hypothetical protein